MVIRFHIKHIYFQDNEFNNLSHECPCARPNGTLDSSRMGTSMVMNIFGHYMYPFVAIYVKKKIRLIRIIRCQKTKHHE